MPEDHLLFGELLVRLGLVTSAQIEEALAQQRRTGQRIGQSLVSLGYVSRERLQQVLLAALGVGDLPVAARPAHAAAATGRAQRDRVVLVDDSEIYASMVGHELTVRGYEVICLYDPREALEQIPRLQPSLVLTDLQMPGMSGAELCSALKAGPFPQLPVIILTGHETEAVSGLRSGADDYIQKGAELDELVARMESVLRRARQVQHVRRLFARYTSDEVVDKILTGGELALSGEKRDATVLFVDIRSFSALSERHPPEQVLGMLNRVLGRLSDVVFSCDGRVDKFLGDGLMAVFGAPVSRDDDALRAVRAARLMMQAAGELRRGAPQGGDDAIWPEGGLQLGIGINTGPVVAGNLGSERRSEYTCIGDTVNVSARLCELARPGQVLIGARTRELLGEAAHVGPHAMMRLRGRTEPTPVFSFRWD